MPVLLVLDTCRAGAAGKQNFVFPEPEEHKGDVGVVTFTACLPGEFSREGARWDNGAFTKALIEGLQGKADTNNDGVVTLAELDAYVSSRTEQLIEEANSDRPAEERLHQHPSCVRPRAMRSSLELARITGPSAPVKPSTTVTLPALFGGK